MEKNSPQESWEEGQLSDIQTKRQKGGFMNLSCASGTALFWGLVNLAVLSFFNVSFFYFGCE